MINKLATVTQKFSPSRRKIIANSAWLLADKILRLGSALFVGVWVARYLGPEQFGLFNYAVAFVSLFGTLATLGLDSIIVRDIVREPSCKDEILGTAFVLKLISGIATLLLTIGTISLLRPNDNLTRWLVAIMAAGLILQSFDIIDFWFQSQVQSKYTVYARNTAFVSISIVKVALIQMRAPLIAFAWAGLAETALSAVGLVILYHVNRDFVKAWRYSFARAKVLLKYSWALILSGIVIMIYMRIDQIMLGQIKDNRAVGIYAVVMKLAEVWYFIPTVIISSVFPSIVKAKQIGENLYYERIQKLFNLCSVLAYAVAIPLSLFSNQIVTLLYGKQYAEAGPVLAIYVWAGVFVYLGAAINTWEITEGLLKLAAITSAIGAVTNVFLNIFLISKYSIMGATISTIISQFIASCGAYAFFPASRKVFIMQLKAILMLDVLKIIKR